jgi:hypothetical protein
MGKIIAAMASSHAYTFLEPKIWDERRAHTRANYKRRYGVEAPDQPQVAEETLESNEARYQRIRDGLVFLRSKILSLRPDVLKSGDLTLELLFIRVPEDQLAQR